MQVLTECLNPNLAEINRALLLRYIGNCTTTSIQRNQYVQVQYENYQLSSPQILSRLSPNNYTVEAYYMPDENGEIKEVYLYQNGVFICQSDKIVAYNTSTAERTEADAEAMVKQAQYIAQFDKMVKEGRQRLANPVIIENNTDFDTVEAVAVERKGVLQDIDFDNMDYSPEFTEISAIDSL